jgi:hypothetical protein
MAARRSRAKAPPTAPQPQTLSAFLEENFRLVSVFGVLVAVSTFAGNLALRAIGIGLSFLFLVAAMLVWVELWRKFPWRGTHWVLLLFRSTLTLITCVIILYWFVFFRDYLGTILPVVLTLVLVLIVARVAQRAGLRDRFRGALGVAGLLVVLVASAAAAAVTSRALVPPSSRLLEGLYEILLAAAP